MNIETIGALLFRALGVVLFLLGMHALLGQVLWYVYFVNQRLQNTYVHDTYFVAGPSIIWVVLLFLSGALCLLFSKALGRVLARGLQ